MNSKTVLAVDPGIRTIGLAVFEGETLTRAIYLDRPYAGEYDRDAQAWAATLARALELLGDQRIDYAVVEMMQAHGSSISSAIANDLLQLSAFAGMFLGALALRGADIGVVRPANTSSARGVVRGWKGGIKKHVHHPRILGTLSAEELALVPLDVPRYIAECRLVGSKRDDRVTMPVGDDLVDAIGIGLWAVGREVAEREVVVGR